ncbi:hypothetical protein [Sphingomonas sp.]|uniref:hypothetical protein n=1 Tax=Sphingomonas sp. TaxID=28214 RepID=UPI00257B8D05|nr:hypothetical protein [Sphingomonas sp.]
MIRNSTTHSSAATADGSRRRSSHSSSGISASDTTSATAVGMKNSAPSFNAKGSPTIRPSPAVSVSAASNRSRRSAITGSLSGDAG